MCAWGGVRFQPSRKKGRWARRLLHLPATFEGELESGGGEGRLLCRSGCRGMDGEGGEEGEGHKGLLSIGIYDSVLVVTCF